MVAHLQRLQASGVLSEEQGETEESYLPVFCVLVL